MIYNPNHRYTAECMFKRLLAQYVSITKKHTFWQCAKVFILGNNQVAN
jgi:hypothetical protein